VPGPVPFTRHAGDTVVVFAGAFRAWHGATRLIEAMRAIHSRGRRDIKAVLIGTGPELAAAQSAAQGLDTVTFTGALPHESMPSALAAADIGVAPFDVSRHAPLQIDFYWSPLKIFEYMAAGLPVVAPRLDRLTRIIGHDREGILYDSRGPDALASAILGLADDAGLRRRLGSAARARAVEQFSWQSHCQALERAIRSARDAHPDRH
jgi:glycosyltransferase involved in cell wall biosynthesis